MNRRIRKKKDKENHRSHKRAYFRLPSWQEQTAAGSYPAVCKTV